MNPVLTFHVADEIWRSEWIGTDGMINYQYVRNRLGMAQICHVPFIAFGELWLASVPSRDGNIEVRKVGIKDVVDASIENSKHVKVVGVYRMADEVEMALFVCSYKSWNGVNMNTTYYARIRDGDAFQYSYIITEKPDWSEYIYDVEEGPTNAGKWWSAYHRNEVQECPTDVCDVLGHKILSVDSVVGNRQLRIMETDRLTGNERVVAHLPPQPIHIAKYVRDDVVVVCYEHWAEIDQSIWMLYNMADGTSYQIPEG
jgi:hypothetical protein